MKGMTRWDTTVQRRGHRYLRHASCDPASPDHRDQNSLDDRGRAHQHAHYSSGLIGSLTQDRTRIIAACDSIIRLNPSAAFMVGAASVWLGIAGQFDRALPLFERSLELNPHHPGWFHFSPWLHAFTNKDYERALAAASQFNMHMNLWDPLLRAATLGKLGRKKEAAMAFQELLNLQPDFAVRPNFYTGCFVHSDHTRTDMLDGLRVGGLP